MKHTIPTLVLCFGAALLAPAAPEDESDARSSSVSHTDSGSQVRSGEEISRQELKVSDTELKRTVTEANRASKLMGMKVKNRQDEDLGTIKDLVVDLESGKVAYAVLSHGGVLGIGGKYVAIPIQALTLQPGDKALLLDLPKQQVAQAPGFDDKHWPDLDAAAKGQTIGLARTSSDDTARGGATEIGDQTTTTSESSTWRTNTLSRRSSASQIDTNSTDTSSSGLKEDDLSDSDSTTDREEHSDDSDSGTDDSSNSSGSNSTSK
jgi:sporulation protein YlmC with PRC-barrel domain